METFKPHKPEQILVVKISKREAILLQKLRKYAFGKVLIHKADGLIIRVEITDSQMIDEDQEVSL